MKSPKLFGYERNVFFIGLTSFFTDTSSKMVYSVMPLFLLSLGASKTTISIIEGIAESAASLLKALSGFWSDRIRRNKPFLIAGYGLTTLITPLYAWVGQPVQVLILRLFERAGKGFRTAPRDSLISSSVRGKETGKNFGFHKAMDNSGAIIGPLAAFLLLYFFPLNFSNIFLLASIPALLGMLTVIFLIKEARAKSEAKTGKISFARLPRKLVFYYIIIFVFGLGNSTDALLLVKTKETGINLAYIPFVYMIFNTVSVFLAIPFGKMSDRIGREKLIIGSFLLYALVYFLFGRFNSLNIFIVLFVLYGVYSAMTESSQKALITDMVGKDLLGTGFGIYHAIIGISLLPASIIAGMLYDKVGNDVPFYFGGSMAILAALLMICFTVFYKHRRQSV